MDLPPQQSAHSQTSNSGAADPGKNGVRDGGSKQSTERKLERSRARNRVAQKLFREKQASYIQYLEHSLECMQESTGPCSTASSSSNQNAVIARLTAKNAELRAALLRLRKGMVSFGELATFHTQDQIFQDICGKSTATDQKLPDSSGDSTDTPHPAVSSADALNAPSGPRDDKIQYGGPRPQVVDPDVPESGHRLHEGVTSLLMPDTARVAEGNTNIYETEALPTSPKRIRGRSIPDHEFWNSPSVPPTGYSSPWVGAPHTSVRPDYLTSHMCDQPFGPTFLDFSATHEEVEKMITHIMSFMNVRTLRQRTMQSMGVHESYDPNTSTDTDTDLDFEDSVLRDVVKLSWRVMQKAQKLDKYIFGAGTSDIVEKIMLWRLQPTEKNRKAIDWPLTPTSLQVANRQIFPQIHYLTWPAMRDQLILNQGSYDPQRFVEDFMDSTVVEIPSLGVCYQTIEAHTVLLRLLARNPQLDECGRSQDDVTNALDADSRLTMQILDDAGIKRNTEYKVLPSFSAKYPFLDTASITTKNPLVPYSVVHAYLKLSRQVQTGA